MTPETTAGSSVEARGATLEEATANAAKELGTDPSELDVTVLDKSAGLFGKQEVTILATVSTKPKRGRAKKAVEEEVPADAEPEPTEKKRTKAKAAEPEAAPKPTRAKKPESEAEQGDEPVATQEIADKYVEVLEEILRLGNLDATVQVSEISGRYVNLDIDGQDASYLVGRKGEVLNALQYLLNVIGVHTFADGARVSLEADDYRKRRADALTKLAEDIATEVVKRGEEAVLDALPAFERRIVHQALSEFDGVTTYSEGEEPDRRVVIAPAQ